VRRAARSAAIASAALTAHACLNARLLRTPPPARPLGERVSVLLPLRDEEARLRPCLDALLAGLPPGAELVVLDDASSDATLAMVRARTTGDERVRVLSGADEPPAGWLGKPWACRRLAESADPASSVLVFLDADVVVTPDGLARTVALLRDSGWDLLSPYPRQLADGWAPRLVQPLLQWSWLTFLPLALATRPGRPSLAAANGQLLAVDRAAYDRSGGHRAVRSEVVEDVALLRAVKRCGGRGGVADGTGIATCRMYDGWPDLRDGYAKSLWSTGSPASAGVVLLALGWLYVLPVVALCRRGSRTWGLAGYAAGVGGRVLTARRTGGRVWPDALAHPASVTLLAQLTGLSWRRRRAGTLHWRGRPV